MCYGRLTPVYVSILHVEFLLIMEQRSLHLLSTCTIDMCTCTVLSIQYMCGCIYMCPLAEYTYNTHKLTTRTLRGYGDIPRLLIMLPRA